ncbi:hypothetical protein H6G33_09815 [Calothrix sp. FACHB-1219]|uniref:hypothetical protein n=1 Tax=unclassified Calothrix TaxID=2619626 RepID=UPI0016826502|nr:MULTISPECIES: hypothetical protein [unclassified Calothrix]MBD2201642.1 hypothetical protein [Calothrix sp. FACHB-168]MBD2217328.1 hypothetical protein [Calothrix sp. FACHB-1219]
MSHFQPVQTDIKVSDKRLLIQAISNQPQIKEVKERHHIRGYYQSVVLPVDIAGLMEGQYDIGYIAQGDKYIMTADLSMGNCGGNGEVSSSLSELNAAIIKEYLRLSAFELGSKGRALEGSHISVSVS